MTIPIHFDESSLAAARRFNARLARMPRFKARTRLTPLLAQGLLRLSQAGGDRRLARRGIRVETRTAEAGGLRVPLRILRPQGLVRGVVLDIHGGGWVFGNARMNDRHNALLVRACGVAVVSVDYRLAVFTPMQGLLDDCLAAARWLLEGGLPEFDALPLILRGESAGAHLGLATLLRLREADPALLTRFDCALLYYGVYDMTGTPSVRAAPAETLVLDGPGMVDALRQLTPGISDAARAAPPLSPLHGALDGLPPALMYAGERDPLRDDTLLLAERWRMAAPVEAHLVPEAPHGFIHFPTPLAGIVLAHTHAWLNARLERWHARDREGGPACVHGSAAGAGPGSR